MCGFITSSTIEDSLGFTPIMGYSIISRGKGNLSEDF